MSRDIEALYQEKLCTPEEAAQVIKSGDWVDYGFFNGKPVAFDRALAQRKGELKDILIQAAVTVLPVPEVVLKDPMGETFTYQDVHFSPVDRAMQSRGAQNVFFAPVVLGECQMYCDRDNLESKSGKLGYIRRDVLALRVTPMDKNGYFNFGLSNCCTFDQINCAKTVIAEVNPNMPLAMGGAQERVHISQIDYIIEDDSPLGEVPSKEPSVIDTLIAEHVLKNITDGSCIQLGIGSMPNVLGKMISQTDLKDLGGHTEMLTESYIDMFESGRMTGMRKNIDMGKIVYTFAMGSKRLYEFIDGNSSLASYNVEYVNHPLNLARIDNLISINQALKVDIFGQISAENSNFKQISGNGGMLDFVQGAYWSKGGKSMVCLPSSYHDKEGNLVSNIIPFLPFGTIVTVPRHSAHMVVTEYGCATLKATGTWARAEQMIAIAHPKFRDELIKEAEKHGIWRQSNKIVS